VRPVRSGLQQTQPSGEAQKPDGMDEPEALDQTPEGLVGSPVAKGYLQKIRAKGPPAPTGGTNGSRY
jgi:hypothetical protein